MDDGIGVLVDNDGGRRSPRLLKILNRMKASSLLLGAPIHPCSLGPVASVRDRERSLSANEFRVHLMRMLSSSGDEPDAELGSCPWWKELEPRRNEKVSETAAQRC